MLSLVSTELGGGDSGNDSAMKGRRLRGGSSWLSKVLGNEQEDRGGDRGSSRKDERIHVSASGPRAVMPGLHPGLTRRQEVAESLQVPEESTLTWFFSSRLPLEQSTPARGAPALGVPSITRSSGATRLPACQLSGRSRICPSSAQVGFI